MKAGEGPRNQWDIRGDSATVGERRCAPARVSRARENWQQVQPSKSLDPKRGSRLI
jgi:hypothetical protein